MDREKYVDESWKESATKEKEKLKKSTGQAKPSSSAHQEEKSPKGSFAPSSNQEPQENEADQQQSSRPAGAQDINFINYVTSLGFQALIFIGEIPHPMTNEIEKNLEQAKFLIDTMAMLKEKTQGNLSKQESDLLNATLYELQLKYVEAVNAEGSLAVERPHD
jgi:hypothetical protein